jgi:hypothetical protein
MMKIDQNMPDNGQVYKYGALKAREAAKKANGKPPSA